MNSWPGQAQKRGAVKAPLTYVSDIWSGGVRNAKHTEVLESNAKTCAGGSLLHATYSSYLRLALCSLAQSPP